MQELLYEDETRIRLLGGAYRGSGTGQQGTLPMRNRSRGSDGFPESMHLISAGDPVPRAVSKPPSTVQPSMSESMGRFSTLLRYEAGSTCVALVATAVVASRSRLASTVAEHIVIPSRRRECDALRVPTYPHPINEILQTNPLSMLTSRN